MYMYIFLFYIAHAVLEDFSCMFTYEKCSIEDFALWIDSIMDNCLKVCLDTVLIPVQLF